MTGRAATDHPATAPPVAGPSRPTAVLYGHRLSDPGATGITRYVRQLVGALAALDQDRVAYVMASSAEAEGPEGRPAGLPHRGPTINRRLLHTAWSGTGRPRVDRWVGHPDLVHVLYPSTPVPSRAPSVYTVHDLMPLRHPEWFAAHERWGFRRATAHLARHARAVIVDSAAVADDVRRMLGVPDDRIHVVHLGVAPEFAMTPGDERVAAVCAAHGVRPGSYVLALGTVSVRKNLAPVIEALAGPELSGAGVGAGVGLVAVGPDGMDGAPVHELVARRSLGHRVHFTGWLPSADLPALLAGAAGLVHPSVEEGFGMTPLEAMSAGVPVAVSAGGSLPEVVGRAALLVDPHDPTAWSRAIADLVGDAGLRADLVARGRAQAAGFTWERTARETLAVHLAVLGG